MSFQSVFENSGKDNIDSVIFSKDDLTISSTGGYGIVSKDDLIITGGIYNVNTD